MREYEIEKTIGDNFAITFIEDGRKWAIPVDDSNADYQRYLIDTNGGLPLPEEQA